MVKSLILCNLLVIKGACQQQKKSFPQNAFVFSRYWVFCQRKQKNNGLPPTRSYSLQLHIQRANYQAMTWKRCLLAYIKTSVTVKSIEYAVYPVLLSANLVMSATKSVVITLIPYINSFKSN